MTLQGSADLAATVGYCSPIATSLTASSLAPCAVAGFVVLHNLTSLQCLRSYSVVQRPLGFVNGVAASGLATAVFFVAQTADGGSVANVTVQCDPSGALNRADLTATTLPDLSAAASNMNLVFRSYAACAVDPLFCDVAQGTACTNPNYGCISGVCFDTSCAQLIKEGTTVQPSSAASLLVRVRDCHGTPLSGLNARDFDVGIDGVSVVSSAVYKGETPVVVAPGPQAVPAVTTLLLDQSASVVDDAVAMASLKAAAKAYVSTVQQQNPSHFLALIAFDGADAPIVLLQHTDQAAAIIAAIDALPPSVAQRTDPGSTNLYGAVAAAVKMSYDMRFSFGARNESVLSSLIVYTDGFDTARRSTAAIAIAAVNSFAQSVRVVSIGVAATSDTAFLAAIATSGFYSFTSSNTQLTTSFADIAQRVAQAVNSYYTVSLCIAQRKGVSQLSIGLNRSRFVTQSIATTTFDASTFSGPCSNATLQQFVTSNTTGATVAQQQPLVMSLPQTASRFVPSHGALFVRVTPNPVRQSVIVTPTTFPVYYVAEARCVLSVYCFDGIANSTFALPASSTRYDLMIVSTSANAATVTVTLMATGADGATTTTPAPTSPLLAPELFGPAAFYYLNYSTAGLPGGDIDAPATWIFFGFGITALILLLAVVVASMLFGGKPSPDESYRSMSPRRTGFYSMMVNRTLLTPSTGGPSLAAGGSSLRRGGGGGGSFQADESSRPLFIEPPKIVFQPLSHTPFIDDLRSPPSRSALRPETIDMTGGFRPYTPVLSSERQPYRHTPYETSHQRSVAAPWDPRDQMEHL